MITQGLGASLITGGLGIFKIVRILRQTVQFIRSKIIREIVMESDVH